MFFKCRIEFQFPLPITANLVLLNDLKNNDELLYISLFFKRLQPYTKKKYPWIFCL